MNTHEYQLDLAVTIVDRGRDKKVLTIYKSLGITSWMNVYGRGTASSEILQYLGLGEPERDVQFSLISRGMVPQFTEQLKQKLSIEKPGQGIMFTIPVSSIAGRRTLEKICAPSNSANENAKEVSPMEETRSADTTFEYSLIVTILNSGSAEAVMEAAKNAGAGGGTVIHGRGLNAKNAEKFFGFTIQAEKDMLLIVAKTSEKDAIMRAIAASQDMTAEGRGMTFSLPVNGLLGISRMMQTENAE